MTTPAIAPGDIVAGLEPDEHVEVNKVTAFGTKSLVEGIGVTSRRLIRRPLGADELARLSATPAELQQSFAQLLALGMIEPLPPPATAATAPVGTPAAAAAPTRIVTLAEAQRAAVRGLTNLLGPTADDLCLRIENARTAQELLAVIKRAEIAVRSARGAHAAAAFMADMQAHRPG